MTVTSGFFNSVNHDRLYDAEQVSSVFDGIIIDGVYENVGDAFMITAYPDANNTVIVGTGRAWFDHTWTVNDSQYSITLSDSSVAFTRMDAIVLDIDRRKNVRANSIKYLAGTLGEAPTKPTLIKEELHKQYPLAYITVPAGDNAPISQSNIQIMVGTEECPIVTGVLEALNLDNLWAQLDSEFNLWWEGIRDVLDENTAMKLQNQIDALNDKIDESQSYGLSKESFDFAQNVSFKSVGNYNSYEGTYTFLPDGFLLYVGHCTGSGDSITGISTNNTGYYIAAVIMNGDGTIVSTKILDRMIDYNSIVGTKAGTRNPSKSNMPIIYSELEEYPVKIVSVHGGSYYYTDIDAIDDVYYKSGCFTKIYTITIDETHTISFEESDSGKIPFSSASIIGQNEFSQNYGGWSTEITSVGNTGINSGAFVFFNLSEKDSYADVSAQYVFPFSYNTSDGTATFGSKPETINAYYNGRSAQQIYVSQTDGSSGIYCVYNIFQSTVSNKNTYALINMSTCAFLDKNTYTVANTIGTNYKNVSIPYKNDYYFDSNGNILKFNGSKLVPEKKISMPPFIEISFGFSGSSSGSVSGKTFTNGAITPDGSIAYCNLSKQSQCAYISGGNGIAIWSSTYNTTIDGSNEGLPGIPNAIAVAGYIKNVFYDKNNKIVRVFQPNYIVINTDDFSKSVTSDKFAYVNGFGAGNTSYPRIIEFSY